MREPSAPQKMFVYGTLMKASIIMKKRWSVKKCLWSLPGPAVWYGI